MKRVIGIILLATAILAGCSTAKKTQQSVVTDDTVSPGDNRTDIKQVVELDLTGIFPADYSGRKVTVNNSLTVMTDQAGKITFDKPEADTILLSFSPCPSPEMPCEIAVPVSDWRVPYKYVLHPDGTVERKSPWVEFRRMPEAVTFQPQFDFLCRSEYPATVRINGEEIKQYKTGIFFTTVKFKEGINKVTAEATMPDGRTASCEQEFIYEKRDKTRQSFPLWVDKSSFEPSSDMQLLPDDVVKISFIASKGQEAFVDVRPGKLSIKCLREDFDDYSVYRAGLPMRELIADKDYTLSIRVIPAVGAPVKNVYNPGIVRQIIVRQPEDYPLVKVKNEYSRLVYNLGAPRLGGPIRSELGPGVILKTNGKIGENYRIRLSNTEEGFINEADVEIIPGSKIQPTYMVSSMVCSPSDNVDIVSIPYLEPVPYEVYPDPNQKRLVITIFGAESAATWVIHRKGCQVIDKLTWNQTTPGTFRVYVNLKNSDIWGYDIRPEGKSLVMRIKHPPLYDLTSDKPLAGLKIAIEAGHGGSNMGAIGLSGLVEKDINLDLSKRLGELCSSMGAEVIQVRDSDKYMTLLDKRNIAISSGADMLISIHANAGGRGYLSTSGTSIYWHNPFWAPLAQAIYGRMLETGLAEFGVVGSFNYTVTRASQLPAVLVEQAFLSNAEDEERLADPVFRQTEAEKIYEGIIDFLRQLVN